MLLYFAFSPGQTKTKQEPLNVQQKNKEKINGESDMCEVKGYHNFIKRNTDLNTGDKKILHTIFQNQADVQNDTFFP